MTTIGMCTATLIADPMAASGAQVRAAAEAAVAAGAPDLSVWAFQIGGLGDVAALGARIAVVEAAMAWAGGDAEATTAEARQLAGLAAEHGATKIVAVTMDPELADIDRARDNLAILVEAATDAGAQVVVEFLPWSGIPDLATAWRLVEPLGPGAGILLDTWHWQRQPGGPDRELLRRIPGERIGYVQLCDAAARPDGDPLTEAMSSRLLPGDGVVDFAEVAALLEEIGATPFVATEIFNPSIVIDRGTEGAAVAMLEAARAVFPA
jgi:sugar phosphate isomerase/epimerase